jgi:hypothetical protein
VHAEEAIITIALAAVAALAASNFTLAFRCAHRGTDQGDQCERAHEPRRKG